MKFNIIYIKTPRAGSTSVSSALRDYGEANDLIVSHDPKPKTTFNINTNHLHYTDRNFNYLKNKVDHKLETLVVSTIRDPLKRCRSHYMGGANKFDMDFNEWYLQYGTRSWVVGGWKKDFKHQYTSNNYMSSYLGYDYQDINEETLKRYDHIFIADRFTESFDVFGKMVGFDFKVYHEHNELPEPYEFTDEVKELFRENNERDYLLYDLVNKKLDDNISR